MALPLSPEVFTILSLLLEERAGIHYALADRELLAEKVSVRAIERGLDSLLDYYYFLRYDERSREEFDALVDTLVVNETYFFREVEQLQALFDHILPELSRDRPSKRVRVWCAAAATGEEPLTLAMMLDERGMLDRVDLLATDISHRALAKARTGVYGGRSLRALPARARCTFMSEVGDGRVTVHPSIHQSVRFRQINLLDAEAIADLGTFDVILCRNVLIYFSDETVSRVVGTLARALHPRGALLVGVSESLMRFGTALACEERGGAFFYRKGREK